jgi:CheY-like chemotaxis protein
MNSDGPVIVIEDDIDDQDLLRDVFKTLKYSNEIFFFDDGHKALEFLSTTDINPFLILSDINMPKIDGFELRDKIRTDAQLKAKCIPYLFFSTGASKKSVVAAYNMSVQGFFKKRNSLTELENTMKVIMDYWQLCVTPNNS